MCSTAFDTVTTLAVVTVIYTTTTTTTNYYYYTIETKYRLPYDKVYFHAPKDG